MKYLPPYLSIQLLLNRIVSVGKQRLLIMLLILISTLFSTFSAHPVYAAADYIQLTQIGSNAEMIGRANVEGFTHTAATLFENPARLTSISNGSISLYRTTLFDEVSIQNVATAYRTQNGVLAVGYFTMSVSGIYHTVEINDAFDTNGEFSYINSLFRVAYGTSLNSKLNAGLSLSQYYTKLDTYSGSGFNVDFGVTYLASPALDMSLTLKNLMIMSDVRYGNNVVENLPLQIVGGCQTHLRRVTLYSQLGWIEGSPVLFKSIGASLLLPLDIIRFRAGYKEFLSLGKDLKKTFTFGTGIQLGNLSVDYAYELGEFFKNEAKHHISVAARF